MCTWCAGQTSPVCSLFRTLSCTLSVSSTVHITSISTQLKPDGREKRRQSWTLFAGVHGTGHYNDLLLPTFRNVKVWIFFLQIFREEYTSLSSDWCYVSWCSGLSLHACTSLSPCVLLHAGKAWANHVSFVLVQSGFSLAAGDHSRAVRDTSLFCLSISGYDCWLNACVLGFANCFP